MVNNCASFLRTIVVVILVVTISIQANLGEQIAVQGLASDGSSFALSTSQVDSAQNLVNPDNEDVKLPVVLQATAENDPIITFTRTGSFGGQWSVCLNGMRLYSSVSNVVFNNVPNGIYSYTVYAETSGWSATPSSGFVTISGSDININIVFTFNPTVTFTRRGSFSGQWSVCLDGMRSYSSTSTITFASVPNGTFSYSVYAESNSWIVTPSSGYITVDGSNVGVNVEFFSNPTVTFTQTGLTGQWSVCLDGARLYSSTSSISFANIPNGTYNYIVYAELDGWIASPSSGYVTVSGSNVVLSITFTSNPSVTFTRTGSFSGQWSVCLEGMRLYSSTSTITFQNVPSGTYSYVVYSEVNGWIASPQHGSVTVITSNVGVNIAFTANPSVTFTRTGSYSGQWSVCFDGMRSFSSTSTITFTNIPDGNYPYVVYADGNGWSASPSSGSVTISGSNVDVGIAFSSVTFPSGTSSITITESGLPSGTQWGVSIMGVTKFSTTDTVQFTNIANGNYQYIVFSTSGYNGFFINNPSLTARVASPSSGAVSLLGSATVSVSFSALASLTFTQTGLTGNHWAVSANGMWSGWNSYTVASITLYNIPQSANIEYVIADNYAYGGAQTFLTPNAGGVVPFASPFSGSVDPNAGTTSVSFTTLATLTFTQTGLAGNYWAVSANGMWSGWNGYNVASITLYNIPSDANINYVIADQFAYGGAQYFLTNNVGGVVLYASPFAGSAAPNQATVNILFTKLESLTFTQTGLTGNHWAVSANGMWSGWNSYTVASITLYNIPQSANIEYVIADNYAYGGAQTFLTPNIGGVVPFASPFSGSVDPNAGTTSVSFTTLATLTFTQTGLTSNHLAVSANGVWSGWYGYNVANITLYNVPESANVNYVIASSNAYNGFLLNAGATAGYYPSRFAGFASLSSGTNATVSLLFRKLPKITFAEMNLPSNNLWSVNLDGVTQSTTSNTISFVNAPVNNSLPFDVQPPVGYYASPDNTNINIGIFDSIQLIRFSTTPPSDGGELSSSTLSVTVLDTQGKPVSNVFATFYDDNQDPLGAVETDATGTTQPVQLPNTIFLGVSPGRQPYYTPSLQPKALSPGSNTATVTLTPYPTGQLSGTVADQTSAAVAGAVVSVSQKINGVDFSNQAITNGAGFYSLSLLSGPTNVRVSAQDYFAPPQIVTIPSGGMATLNTVFQKLEPCSVRVNVFTKYLGDSAWTGPLPIDWIEAVHFGIRILDAMGKSYTVTKNPYSMLGYAGETIQVSANGVEAGLSAASQSVVLDANRNAEVSLYLAQQGQIRATITDGSQPVKSWTANIYSISSDGQRTFVVAKTNNAAALIFNPQSAGQYTFDLQGVSIGGNTLGGSLTVTVQAAQILDLGNVALQPTAYFTGTPDNEVIAIPNQVSPGQTFDLRATYHNGAATLSNVGFYLEIPAETSLVPGSITLNQQQINNAYLLGNFYVVSAGILSAQASGTLTYRLIVSEDCKATSLNPCVQIHYTYASLEHIETIGSINILVDQVTITAPSVLGSLNTMLSGQSPPESKITVYDNDTVLGQITSSPGGYWQLAARLPDANFHELHAQAISLQGISLNSVTLGVIYDPTKPQLILVSLQQANSREISFNPQDGIAQFPYVVVPHVPINFELTFSDTARISDVYVDVDGCEVANATLGSDGLFHAIVYPGGALGSIYVGYTLLPFPKGNGVDLPPILPTPLSEVFPGSSYTVASDVTHMSASLNLPNGGLITGEFSVTPDVSYTVTSEDVEQVNRSGYPIYGSSVSVVESSSQFRVDFSCFVPYYAQSASLVKQIDGPANTVATVLRGVLVVGSATGNPIAVLMMGVVGSGDLIISCWADSEAFHVISDRMWYIHNYLEYCKKIAEQSGCSSQMNFIMQKITEYTNLQKKLYSELTGQALSDCVSSVPCEFLAGLGVSYSHDLFGSRIQNFVNDIESLYRSVAQEMHRAAQSGKISHNPDQTARPKWVYDPSGFVYEAVLSNRLADVTASIFYQDQDTGQWILWDATEYGQQNNLLTDIQGNYGWYVPEGKWRVSYLKAGYTATQSGAYDVPPPATDVNVGLVPVAAPVVDSVSAVTSGSSFVRVHFSQFMKVSTLNQNNIYLTSNGAPLTGSVSALNSQQDPNGVFVAREAVFTLSSPFSLGSVCMVNVDKSVQNFAGFSMLSSYSAQVTFVGPPGYSVSTTLARVPLGGSVSSIAITDDSLSAKIRFTWIRPDGTETQTANVPVAGGRAQSPEFYPDKEGVWTVKAEFMDGINVFASRTTSFYVVQPEIRTLNLGKAVVNSTGGFKINLGEVLVEVGSSNGAPGTELKLSSFVYKDTPPGIPNLALPNTFPVEYQNLVLNNTAIGGTALVNITSFAANATSSLYYYSSSLQQWVQASNVVFIASENPFGAGTVSGRIPVSGLAETAICIVNVKSAFSINIVVVGQGSVSRSISEPYDYGQTVALTALPSADWSFSGWSGDLSGSSNPADIVMTSNKMVTATFVQVGYTVSFTRTGLPSSTEWQVTLNGNTKSSTIDKIEFTGVAAGSYSYSVLRPIAGQTGTRYTTSPSSGTINVPAQTSVSVAYTTQYRLSIVTNFGTTMPSVGDSWYNAGSIVTVSATSPSVNVGERYVWNGWVGTGTGSYTGPNNPATNALTINGPITQTASWIRQYQILVTADPSGALGGTFEATYTKLGIQYTNQQCNTPWSEWVDANSILTVSNPQYTIPNTMLKFDHYYPSSGAVTVTSKQTITLYYVELPTNQFTSVVTDGGLCYFDKDSSRAGQQFRLIFTQDPANPSSYKLTASNPGQFAYNVFYIGTPGESVNIEIIVPYPFVTQGTNPIHVYSKVAVGAGPCYTPSAEVFDIEVNPSSIQLPVTAQDAIIDVEGLVPSTGLVFVTIHLDFGFKQLSGYTQGANLKAVNSEPFSLINYGTFKFSVTDSINTYFSIIENENTFKRNPGIGGLVTDLVGSPVQGASITVSGDGKTATVTTDNDGWYMYSYKYTGKPAVFTVTLNGYPNYPNRIQKVTLKSNSFLVVNFPGIY